MASDSRFTDDELDDLIFDELECRSSLRACQIRQAMGFAKMQEIRPRTSQYTDESFQLMRRLCWLVNHDFLRFAYSNYYINGGK